MFQRRLHSVLVIASALALAPSAHADGNPATDDVVNLFPYTGTLERDGAAVSGPIEMEFALYDARGASGTPIWVETQMVEVYRGRFTALLGLCDQNPSSPDDNCPIGGINTTDIEATIRNADDLLLGIRLFPSAASIDLQNRKRFFPVPYAVWTRAATDLEVAHDLTVRRNAAVSGTSSLVGDVSLGRDLAVARNATVSGTLTVNGALSATGMLQGAEIRGRAVGTYYTRWSSSARGCLLTCQELGGRMATYDELFAVAATGTNWCAYNWFIHPSFSENPCTGYPMYTNYTTTGQCGRINTGERPRLEEVNCNYDWDNYQATPYCACSLIK